MKLLQKCANIYLFTKTMVKAIIYTYTHCTKIMIKIEKILIKVFSTIKDKTHDTQTKQK